jgi:carboxypeptidase Q
MKLAVSSLALAGFVLVSIGAAETDALQKILDAGLRSDGAYRKLAWICDRIGPRLSGSENLEKAVAWCAAEMKRDGLDNVHTEKVMVPHWVRGEASGRILAPAAHPMAILALGMSDGTKPQGITAEIVEAKSLEELAAIGDRAKGKIVLFNKPIYANGGEDRGYGSAVGLRYGGRPPPPRSGRSAC